MPGLVRDDRLSWRIARLVGWVALVAVPFAPPRAAAEEGLRVGAAREAFSLPRHVPLAGYSRRNGKPSIGQHDPVGVHALVLQDADTTLALVSCDLLIIDERLFDAVRRRLIAEGLPQNLILFLAATHTHSGPGAYGRAYFEKLSMGHFDPTVFDHLVDTAVRAVRRAHEALAPCRIAYQTAPTSGLVINRRDPGGMVDGELVVCAFYRPEQRTPLAVLVNFAAHPTSLGAWNMELSADYPGVVAREMAQHYPGAVCLFFAGAVGDQGPVKRGDRFERAEEIGRSLATTVQGLLETATIQPVDGVEARQERLSLPPARVRLGSRVTLPRWIGRSLVDDDATLSVAAVGPIAFLGVPCDLDASLGLLLKRAVRSNGWQPVLIGFASDYIGYCVTEKVYRTGGYEALMAFNGPKTGELIVERLEEMIDVFGAPSEE